MSKVKYVECFPYNGEDALLRLKLRLTDELVDWWVITEGALTHTSHTKELRFDYDNFPEYRHKIIYVPLRDFPYPEGTATSRPEYWENEFYMRNAAMNAVRKVADKDTIIITGDLDEVLKADRIREYNPNKYVMAITELPMSYYRLNQMSVFFDGYKADD